MADLQAEHKSASRAVLGVISLSVIFFPTIFSSITKPYVFDGFMYTYWISAFLSFIFLTTAYYQSAFSDGNLPVKAVGMGNMLAALAIGCLFVFIFGNIISDRISPPRIVDLTLSKTVLSRSDFLEVKAVASDDDGDDLVWEWCVRPSEEARAQGAKTVQLEGHLRTVVWEPPNVLPAGSYYIEVAVDDGARKSKPVRQAFRIED
ncbi:hypothetical protein J7399_05360 [Shimia sp. R9_1]|uniref:hypothetical protein n=1 Tax=Shimia sp. R9_1 TaxID=2821111 RepID=UPI001ADD126F|nr:hypothetical protein [Shimia sp. R9_1]MBO9406844.1 hypothetical protein [Shimia sp. R9_1]